MDRQLGPALSRRLEGVLGLLRPCALLADVGTDHAQIPVAAVCRGLAVRAIAADLREAPLCGARAQVERAGVSGRVLVLQADGLSGMQHRGVDAVVIAGMSAGSMLRIFEPAADVLAHVEQLVVQPNQNVEQLRAWGLRSGWHLHDEHMLEHRGRFFVVCAFARGTGEDPAYAVSGWTAEALCHVGPLLLLRKDATARLRFEQQRARVSHWVQRGVLRLKPELDVWDAACAAMGSRDEQNGLPRRGAHRSLFTAR
jgi:tRNA (adenine22-N1)-methyltransferase